MKRPRVGGGVAGLFGDDSESESVDTAPKKRFSRVEKEKSLRGKEDDHGEDPLDSFMNTLSQAGKHEEKQQQALSESSDEIVVTNVIRREEMSQPVEEEMRAERLARDLVMEPVDHSARQYAPFVACKYRPLPRIARQSAEEREERLRLLNASIQGERDIIPIEVFQDLALVLSEGLLRSVLGTFERPTPIQQVAIPAALQGYNVLGVAKTGSGKTAAYAIPLLCHISVQPRSTSIGGKGPTALVVVPTRELALQIAGVIRRLGEGAGIGVMCVVGGHAKYEQYKKLRDSGAEVVVCTPGRMIDMLKMKACGLMRCSYVVLDEADRMFDMGFGQQVEALLGQIRPDAQMLLFSATFPSNVAGLVKRYVKKPVRVTIHASKGEREGGESFVQSGRRKGLAMVSENVTEVYIIVDNELQREQWLLKKLDDFLREGLVIVFCPSRGGAATVANIIRKTGKPAACVHGETDHGDREGLLRMFRSGELPLLVTTDLSARGLDIAHVNNVVNYGCAKSWDWHVHRSGRTGRAAEKGTAYTVISRSNRADTTFVTEAIAAYQKSALSIPKPLLEFVEDGRGSRELQNSSKRSRGRRRFR